MCEAHSEVHILIWVMIFPSRGVGQVLTYKHSYTLLRLRKPSLLGTETAVCLYVISYFSISSLLVIIKGNMLNYLGFTNIHIISLKQDC